MTELPCELCLLSVLESSLPSSIANVGGSSSSSIISSVGLVEERADITLSDTVVLLDVVLELTSMSLANMSSDKPT